MVLDVDGLPVEVHGHPPGSEWNGYYHQRMYHGLVASCAETGDLIDGEIFPGVSYLGKKALKLTLRMVDRCRGRLCGSMIVRMDAGFPEPGLLQGLESRSVPYIARIGKNEVLNRMAKPYLTQPAGRSPKAPPRLWFHELTYQAESWDRARRVVLVVRERPGELYPDHFWLLTSLSRKRYEAEALLAKYRKRGKAEGHMGELMDVLDPALSSASRPKTHYRGKPLKPGATTEAGVRPHNEVLFLLNLLGYEILHLGRVLMEQAIVGAGVCGPVEGTETVGISHRKVNLSAGDGPLGRKTVYDRFNSPVFEPIQSNRQRFNRNRAPTARKSRVGSPYQHVP